MAAAFLGAAPVVEAAEMKGVILLFAMFTIIDKKRKKDYRIRVGDGFYRLKRQILDTTY